MLHEMSWQRSPRDASRAIKTFLSYFFQSSLPAPLIAGKDSTTKTSAFLAAAFTDFFLSAIAASAAVLRAMGV